MAANEIDPRFAAITGQLKFATEEQRVPALVDLCKESLARTLKVLDAHLANNKYLLGENFSAVDCVYGHFAPWEKWLELDLTASLPNVSKYLERVQSKPTCPWT